MDWNQIITTLLGVLVIVGSMFKFMWSRIDKKFEQIFSELKEIKTSVQNLEIRISRLETQDEERFRNEIKLLVSERNKGG